MPSAEHQRRDPWPDRLIRTRRSTELRLNLRNLYILPSRFGWLWLLTCAVLYVMGTSGASASALLLAYGGLGLFLLAPFLTQFNLQGLELHCGDPQPGFAGGSLTYPLQVTSAVERLELRVGFQRQPERWVGPIPSGSSRLAIPWIPQRRGLQRPGRLRLESQAPLGLFVCWSLWEPDRRQLVYPARRAGPVAMLLESPATGMATLAADPRKSGVDDWQDLQPHRPEEGATRLAWKQLARSGERLSKQFSRDGGVEPSWLMPDPELPLEEALEHMADRCCQLARVEATFGVLVGSLTVPPACGLQHLHRCLEALALASRP